MNQDTLKAGYDTVTSLYDIADELAATAENKSVQNLDEYMNSIEPLINEISDSCDELAEDYIMIIEEPQKGKTVKNKIEKAIRKLFMALEKYKEQLQEVSGETMAVLSGLANPIITKIQKQAEKIMLIFMQMLEISLDKILRKNEIDEFKKNNYEFMPKSAQISY